MTILVAILSLAAAGLASQPALETEAERFAEAWSSSDTEFLTRVLAEGGIRLHLPGEDHVLIRPRQARAALEGFLGRHGPGEALVTRASLAGGSTEKGFAEIRWTTSSPGLPDPVIFILFVGYSLENDRWTVTEIRVLF